MKTFEELTPDECQTFLNEMFEDVETKFEKLILEPNDMAIEYSVKSINMDKCYLSFSNPDFLLWMYKHDFDITSPLKYLKYEYNEMDETNSILFEYAMEVGRIIQNSHKEFDYEQTDHTLIEIEKLQKDLVKKI